MPPLLAAWLLRIPTVLHEQNAVMGRANRFLSSRVSLVACGFPELKGVDAATRAKTRYTGNPVRPAVLAAAATPYPDFAGRRLGVLVTGGSQGARVMADVVPAALALLSADERQWIRLTQQARGEDKARVAAACARMSFPVEIAEFFADLPARIAAAHLVVGRAGASTVSELAVIGRPSVLVPFPHALDQDQAANAAALAAAGGAIVVPQPEFTPAAAGGDPARGAGLAGEACRRGESGESVGRRGRGGAARRSRAGDRPAGVSGGRIPSNREKCRELSFSADLGTSVRKSPTIRAGRRKFPTRPSRDQSRPISEFKVPCSAEIRDISCGARRAGAVGACARRAMPLSPLLKRMSGCIALAA